MGGHRRFGYHRCDTNDNAKVLVKIIVDGRIRVWISTFGTVRANSNRQVVTDDSFDEPE
jgi:hypothetical protein